MKSLIIVMMLTSLSNYAYPATYQADQYAYSEIKKKKKKKKKLSEKGKKKKKGFFSKAFGSK